MGKVVIGLKVPNGIRLGEYLIHGFAHAPGSEVKHPIACGYALTADVDEDVWNAWLKANADSYLVQKQLIFAEHGMGNAKNKARSLLGVSGQEQGTPQGMSFRSEKGIG
jgi:hypothetical protein